MKKDKKHTFYNSKNRNQKWTEEPVGRQIDFADKYIYDGSGSDKYSAARQKSYDEQKRLSQKRKKNAKKFTAVLLCVVMLCVGYIGMDVYMTRHAKPAQQAVSDSSDSTADISSVSLELSSRKIECVSLDNSVMLDSVISDVQENGCNSITFDAKRNDGTIGYSSSLASIDTFGALSNNSTATKQSVKKLTDNDILPIARISCYRDNVVPSQSDSMALMQGDKYYTDSNNNTYLNPDSEDTYNYIKDIVRELYSYGVTVFVLTNYDLPSDVSSGYSDGFSTIAQKLNNDFENSIKIVQEVDVKLSGKDEESGKITNTAISKEIKNFKKIENDQIYYITTSIDDERVLTQLTENGITNFIL